MKFKFLRRFTNAAALWAYEHSSDLLPIAFRIDL